jgi:hypothetical protein
MRVWTVALLATVVLLAPPSGSGLVPRTPPLAPAMGPPFYPPGGGGGASVDWSINASLAGVRVTGAVTVELELPDGGIDRGRVDPLRFGLTAPALTDLNLSGPGFARNVPVPTLGSIGPEPLPGLSVTLDGVNASVLLTVGAVVSANGSLGGSSFPLLWNGTGTRFASVPVPPTVAVGQAVPVGLTAIAYGLTLNLTVVGTAPVVGRFSVPLLPAGPFVEQAGVPALLASNLTATEAPSLTSVSVDPDRPTVGSAFLVTTVTDGGAAPLGYRYSGLPPGCASENLSVLSCTANASGSYTISVEVVDADGAAASGSVPVTVVDPSPSPWTEWNGALDVLAILAVASATGAVVTLLRARSNRRGPP